MNWTETDANTRKLWFNDFKSNFQWHPSLEEAVKAGFECKARERLKDMVCKASKKPLTENIKWFPLELRLKLNERRKDPDFMEKSVRNQENKKGGSERAGSSITPGHHQGSRSSIEIARNMAKDNNGEMPLAADLYLASHSKVLESGEMVLHGKKANETMTAYKRKLDEYKSQGSSYVPHPNEVWYEVTGGYQKGKVYGLGQSASLYYEKPSNGSSQSSSSISSISPLSTSHTKQVEELKKQNEALRKEREEDKKALENVKKEQEEMKNAFLGMQSALLEMSQAFRENGCSNMFSPSQPRDPRDPSDDGGTAPCI